MLRESMKNVPESSRMVFRMLAVLELPFVMPEIFLQRVTDHGILVFLMIGGIGVELLGKTSR
jgi:hypothetical protein